MSGPSILTTGKKCCPFELVNVDNRILEVEFK